MATLSDEIGENGIPWREAAKQHHGFRINVEKLLPSTTSPLNALPNFRAMLKDIGEEKRYGSYMRLSQFAHGTHVAGGLYRKNLGGEKVEGEFISPESWEEPLKCAWWCLAIGGTTILQKLGGNPEAFVDGPFLQRVTVSLDKV